MIAIVGAGIGGLALGHHLDRAGAEYVVLESTARAGGLVGSRVVEGRVLERGPQRARLTPPLHRLLDELGLIDEVVTAPALPLYLRVDGRLHSVPFTPRAALASGILRGDDRVRVLLEPLRAGLRDGETAGEFFERKFGRRVYRRLIAPLYGGLFASDPADMPARHTLAPALAALGVRRSVLLALLRGAGVRSGAPACSFRAGLQTLVDTLAARQADRLRRCAGVRALHRDGHRLRVVGDGVDLRVDHVVLTCPADAAAAVIRSLAPDTADALGQLRYNALAVVHLHSPADIRAMGYHLPLDDGRATWGVTSNHAIFARDGVYTAFLGGAKRPDVAELDDGAVAGLAIREFTELVGEPARPLAVDRARMPAWDRSWDALPGVRLPTGVSACASWNGRPGLTGRLAAAAALAERLTR